MGRMHLQSKYFIEKIKSNKLSQQDFEDKVGKDTCAKTFWKIFFILIFVLFIMFEKVRVK